MKRSLSLPSCNSASLFRCFGLVLIVCAWAPALVRAETAPDISILTYDSFVAKHGLGPEIMPVFKQYSGCEARVTGAGDGGQLLNRLQLSAKSGSALGAQVVLGIDQQLWEDVRPFAEPWGKWSPVGYEKLVASSRVEKGFLPFDYGTFAFIADTEALKKMKLEAPHSLQDLLKPEWKRNLILEDPRTSTPGLALLRYSIAVYQEKVWEFWTKLRPQWLTLAQGWDAAYGIFLKGEAPLVWSYTTSQAYHDEHPEPGVTPGRYQAIHFTEGQPSQIEGAILVKGAFTGKTGEHQLVCARKFLEFLLTPAVQARIPLKNWMSPVIIGTPLPPSFKRLPVPKRIVPMPVKGFSASSILPKWSHAVEATP